MHARTRLCMLNKFFYRLYLYTLTHIKSIPWHTHLTTDFYISTFPSSNIFLKFRFIKINLKHNLASFFSFPLTFLTN